MLTPLTAAFEATSWGGFPGARGAPVHYGSNRRLVSGLVAQVRADEGGLVTQDHVQGREQKSHDACQ